MARALMVEIKKKKCTFEGQLKDLVNNSRRGPKKMYYQTVRCLLNPYFKPLTVARIKCNVLRVYAHCQLLKALNSLYKGGAVRQTTAWESKKVLIFS